MDWRDWVPIASRTPGWLVPSTRAVLGLVGWRLHSQLCPVAVAKDRPVDLMSCVCWQGIDALRKAHTALTAAGVTGD